MSHDSCVEVEQFVEICVNSKRYQEEKTGYDQNIRIPSVTKIEIIVARGSRVLLGTLIISLIRIYLRHS